MTRIPRLHKSNRKDAREVLGNLQELDKDLLHQALLSEFNSSQEFKDHIKWLVENDNSLHLGIGYDFLGFIEDYYFISELLTRPRCNEQIIVDVGCATGLQHVFFSEFKQYIGIDYEQTGFKSFAANSSFVEGEFASLVESGRFIITDNMVGVANMSLLYGNPNKEKSLAAFELFSSKILI